MAKQITKPEAMKKATELIQRICGGNVAGLHDTGETRFGRINWIVELEGGVPKCYRFTIFVNATTGEILHPVKKRRV